MSERPWLEHYPPGVPSEIAVDAYPSLVSLMKEAFQRHAGLAAYRFMGSALSFAERCLLLRNETPRALEVAAELFRRA